MEVENEIQSEIESRLEEKERNRPLEKFYLPLGMGKGIQFVLWSSNLQLNRTEKNESGKWETKQEFNLDPSVLKELHWRIPSMLDRINENGQYRALEKDSKEVIADE